MPNKQGPMTEGEVRTQVIKHDKRIKRLILKKLRTVKFPVKIRPETLKFANKNVDYGDMLGLNHGPPTFSMHFFIKCENTRFIIDAEIDGSFIIDLTDIKSGDNLFNRAMIGDWSFHGHFGETDEYRINWKSTTT